LKMADLWACVMNGTWLSAVLSWVGKSSMCPSGPAASTGHGADTAGSRSGAPAEGCPAGRSVKWCVVFHLPPGSPGRPAWWKMVAEGGWKSAK
jgi:hypothetical protein